MKYGANMIEVDGEQWLDTSEVLGTLKISRSTLYAIRKRGESVAAAGSGVGLLNIKLGRCLYFSQRSISAWMHAQEEAL